MHPSVVPLIRYRNPVAACDWLVSAFGFERQSSETAEDGSFTQALLTLSGSMVMVSRVSNTAFDQLFKQPDEIGGAETQTCFFVVPDIEAHFAKAKAAGAQIVFELGKNDHGGRGYSCRDPEGRVWTFGTRAPGRALVPAIDRLASVAQDFPVRSKSAALAASIAVALCGLALIGVLRPTSAPSTVPNVANGPREDETAKAAQDARLIEVEKARDAAEAKARDAEAALAKERDARAEAERANAEAAAKLDQAPKSVEAAAPETTIDAGAGGTEKEWNAEVGGTSAAGTAASLPITETVAGGTLVERGRDLMAHGDIAAARRLFQEAADEGQPEGALALGSTYDPASLASIGLAATPAEPETARHWYRRAHELAAAPKQPDGRNMVPAGAPQAAR